MLEINTRFKQNIQHGNRSIPFLSVGDKELKACDNFGSSASFSFQRSLGVPLIHFLSTLIVVFTKIARTQNMAEATIFFVQSFSFGCTTCFLRHSTLHLSTLH